MTSRPPGTGRQDRLTASRRDMTARSSAADRAEPAAAPRHDGPTCARISATSCLRRRTSRHGRKLAAALVAVSALLAVWVSPSAASWCAADIALLGVDPTVCDAFARNEASLPSDVSPDEMRWVHGIYVHRSIAADIAALVAAAEADGHTVRGEGYRSAEQQALLRRAHCGTDPHSVYLVPGWHCTPPTARPGHSMHQRGLAIDFTINGAPIDETDALYGWLTDNAARFGLRNFPAEPWHWSTNGK